MTQDVGPRTEMIRLTSERKKPMLLCLEPLGEQVTLEPCGAYEIMTWGGEAGNVELILQDDKLIVYGWNGSDSAVFQSGKRIAGMEPPSSRL